MDNNVRHKKWNDNELKGFFCTKLGKKIGDINYEMSQKGIPIILKAEYNTDEKKLTKKQKNLFDNLIQYVNKFLNVAILPNHLIQYKDVKAYQKSILLDWFPKIQLGKSL